MKKSVLAIFTTIILKAAIVIGAGYYIYVRIILHPEVEYRTLREYISTGNIPVFIGIMSIFSVANWLWEGKKWQLLAGSLVPVTYGEALSQSLAAHIPALITPLKSGEFGGKMGYYPAYLRKKIAGRVLLGNVWQMAATLLFGLVGIGGLFYFTGNAPLPIPKRKVLSLAVVLLLGIPAGGTLIKRYKTAGFIKNLSLADKSINRQTALYSILRYLTFSHQYYFTLKYLGFTTGYMESMSLIFSLYLISTFIPVAASLTLSYVAVQFCPPVELYLIVKIYN